MVNYFTKSAQRFYCAPLLIVYQTFLSFITHNKDLIRRSMFITAILGLIGLNATYAQTWTNLNTGDSYTGAGALTQLHDDADTGDGDILELSPAGGTYSSLDLFDTDHDYSIITKAVIIDGNNSTISNSGFPTNTSAAIWFQADAAETMTLQNITLCGFTHTNGSALKNTYFQGSKIVYENVNVWNSANNSYAVWVEGDCDIVDCSFSKPLQTSNTGGLSIRLWGDIPNTVNITDSQFDCNRKDGNGSSIEIVSTTNSGSHKKHEVNFIGGSISNNDANYAALFCGTGKDTEITMTDVQFINNKGGNNEDGSAVYMARASSPAQYLILNECLFQNNSGGNDNHLIRGGISSDRVIANNCVFIQGSSTSANLIEINSGAEVNSSVLHGITFNNDGGTESGNTHINTTNSGVMTDYWYQGVGPGNCGGGCVQPLGYTLGAQVSLGCEENEEVLTSTMTGDWFYQIDGSSPVAFGAGGTTATIPEALRGEFVTFWQEVDTGSDPVFAFTVDELPEINGTTDDPCFGSISGTIFQDGDETAGSANGTADGGEGLSGVVIHLLDGFGVAILDGMGNAITTTTDASGNYEFYNLPNGDYQIGIIVPAGMVGTTYEDTGSTTDDSDVPQGTDLPGSMIVTSTITIAGSTTPSDDDTYTGSMNIVSVGAGFIIDAMALPVVLAEFNIYEKDCMPVLQWRTESEINNDKFEIQRSMSGISFGTIGEVKGNGTLQNSVEYRYEDATVKMGEEYYYRLKQVDIDGRFDYSDIVSQRVNCNSSFSGFNVYPTLISENNVIKIFSNESSKVIDVRLVNMSGQEVYSNSKISFLDNDILIIDINQMASGIFFLTIADENQNIESYKIIKL